MALGVDQLSVWRGVDILVLGPADYGGGTVILSGGSRPAGNYRRRAYHVLHKQRGILGHDERAVLPGDDRTGGGDYGSVDRDNTAVLLHRTPLGYLQKEMVETLNY